MNFKTIAGSALIHLLIAFCLGWFAGDHLRVTVFPPSISFKDDSHLHAKIKSLENEQDSLYKDNAIREGVILNLEGLIFKKSDTIDSLQTVIIRIRNQSRKKTTKIDSLIADDSTNAVEQYRIALQNLGVIPNLTAHLTFREIGHGAKFLDNLPALQLELFLMRTAFDELNDKYDLRQQAFEELQKISSNDKLLLVSETKQKEEWKTAYEDETGFWKDRIIWGVGYGVQFNFNTEQVTHGIQTGIYFRIWGL